MTGIAIGTGRASERGCTGAQENRAGIETETETGTGTGTKNAAVNLCASRVPDAWILWQPATGKQS